MGGDSACFATATGRDMVRVVDAGSRESIGEVAGCALGLEGRQVDRSHTVAVYTALADSAHECSRENSLVLA